MPFREPLSLTAVRCDSVPIPRIGPSVWALIEFGYGSVDAPPCGRTLRERVMQMVQEPETTAGSRGEKAARMLEEGLELSGQTKDRPNLAHFLSALAAVDAFRGRAERSALLFGAADALLREVGAPVYNFYVPDPTLQERAVAEARAVLGDAAFEMAREQGREMTFEQAIEYALEGDEASPA